MSNSGQAKDLFDKAKKAAIGGVDKVKKAAAENPGKVRGGIDKVTQTADKVTKGKYTDKIQTAGNKVEETVQKQAHKPTPGVNPTGTDATADGGFTADATGTTGAPGTAGAPDAGTAGRRPGHVPDPVDPLDRPDPIDRPGPLN